MCPYQLDRAEWLYAQTIFKFWAICILGEYEAPKPTKHLNKCPKNSSSTTKAQNAAIFFKKHLKFGKFSAEGHSHPSERGIGFLQQGLDDRMYEYWCGKVPKVSNRLTMLSYGGYMCNSCKVASISCALLNCDSSVSTFLNKDLNLSHMFCWLFVNIPTDLFRQRLCSRLRHYGAIQILYY